MNYLSSITWHICTADSWSFAGVIFYEMLYGRRPFHANVDQETIATSQLLLHPNALAFNAKPVVSQGAKDFIKRLLSYDHQLRPDVHEAAADVYLMSAKDRRRSVPTAALRPPGTLLFQPLTVAEWPKLDAVQ